ncbi:hypothetical protein GCM10022205_44620 [Spinactinospora alkalitolerans]
MREDVSDEFGGVGRWLRGLDADAERLDVVDTVDGVNHPLHGPARACDKVPATAQSHQAVGLYVDGRRLRGVVTAVADADGFVRATGERGGDEYVAAGAARGSPWQCLYVCECGKPGPPARWHDLSELGQRGDRRGLQSFDGNRCPQSECDRGGLVCVQQ